MSHHRRLIKTELALPPSGLGRAGPRVRPGRADVGFRLPKRSDLCWIPLPDGTQPMSHHRRLIKTELALPPSGLGRAAVIVGLVLGGTVAVLMFVVFGAFVIETLSRGLGR